MRKRSLIFAVGLLSVLAASSAVASGAGAKPADNTHKTTKDSIVEYAFDPEPVADAIVVYTPNAHHALDKMESSERVLTGRVDKQEKGKNAPKVIVHKANTMIMPLEAGKPVRMYLKRFPDRDAYYPIAIFSVSQGAK